MKRYDLNYLKEISGGDEEFILDMIQTFVQNTPSELLHLKNLAKEQKWDILGEQAHRFAPGLQFLGLISLRPVINKIEDFSFGKKNLEEVPDLINKLEAECRLVSDELIKDFNLKLQ
ncbi:MAG TPA: Hpt domain-containing protein [Bacteroidales bacterium]|jgi:HPt (histidine-containing phosphotransfer) domain-containing protein|nr:Hpt domain-containing protein [Bacteroidales bacterium]